MWLTEMDLQLTNVEHFSESDADDKMRQLNVRPASLAPLRKAPWQRAAGQVQISPDTLGADSRTVKAARLHLPVCSWDTRARIRFLTAKGSLARGPFFSLSFIITQGEDPL